MKLQIDKLGKVAITVDKNYWDISKDYDRLVIVEKENIQVAFISRKPVPAGTNIFNREYWIPIAKWVEVVSEFGTSLELTLSQKFITDTFAAITGRVQALENIGGQPNVIEHIVINNIEQQPVNKTITFHIPTTTGELQNTANFTTLHNVLAVIEQTYVKGQFLNNNYYNKTAVNNLIATALTSVITPKGTITFENLPTPDVENLGFMYNVSNAFTITAAFVEYDAQHPKSYPAGTNVYVVDCGTPEFENYKYDVLPGFVDLSSYYNETNTPVITDAELAEVTSAIDPITPEPITPPIVTPIGG